MSKPKGGDWLTLAEARRRLGLGQVSDLLHLLLAHDVAPRRRRGSLWVLTQEDVLRLERLLERLAGAGSCVTPPHVVRMREKRAP
jgi:hypothetical protein